MLGRSLDIRCALCVDRGRWSEHIGRGQRRAKEVERGAPESLEIRSVVEDPLLALAFSAIMTPEAKGVLYAIG